MVSTQEPVTNIQLKVGVLVEPWPEFQEFLEVVQTEVDKPLSVICVEKVECSLLYIHGEDGTEESIKNKKDTPLLLLSLPQD